MKLRHPIKRCAHPKTSSGSHSCVPPNYMTQPWVNNPSSKSDDGIHTHISYYISCFRRQADKILNLPLLFPQFDNPRVWNHWGVIFPKLILSHVSKWWKFFNSYITVWISGVWCLNVPFNENRVHIAQYRVHIAQYTISSIMYSTQCQNQGWRKRGWVKEGKLETNDLSLAIL